MSIWVWDDAAIQPGDRVEVALSDPLWVLWRGVFVCTDDLGQICILADGDYGKVTPVHFRPSQVRPENCRIKAMGISAQAAETALSKALADYNKPVPWWNLKAHLIGKKHPSEDPAIQALSLAIDNFRMTEMFQARLQIVPKSYADEIITHTSDGLVPGAKVRVKIPADSGGPAVVDGVFKADFRGWRFFTYWHGGGGAYPISEVTPSKRKRSTPKGEKNENAS